MNNQKRIEPLESEEKYTSAIKKGLEINKSQLAESFFPKGTVGHFLSRRAKCLKDIYDYYSRKDIQQAMFGYAIGRKITYLRSFRPLFSHIIKPEDILPLTLYTLFEQGNYWPSIHGTISRYTKEGKRLSDVVLEMDYKANWKNCFEMTRPVVDMLYDRGAIFRLKFSGHSSVHIILPAESLQVEGYPLDHITFFRHLSDVVKKKLREPRYLDTSFYIYDHYLRLAYSLNEITGLVSLPFDFKDYDRFNPDQASPNNVHPIPGWWSFPKDAAQQMQEFIQYVMRGNIILEKKLADDLTTIQKPKSQDWQVDQKIVRQVKQQKKAAAREFLPNEGFYDRMVRIGQDIIDLREFILLDDSASKKALRALRHLYNSSQKPDINSVSRRFEVDESDLKLLWDWELNERIFRYYARDEIRQAIFDYAENRKIKIGEGDKLVFPQEPADIFPLIVYAYFRESTGRDKYPVIYSTNSKYERTGKIAISCDVRIEFSTKNDKGSILEALEPIISLLSGFEIYFTAIFDGIRGIELVLPYESLPEGAKLASIRHEDIIFKLSPHLKKAMRVPGATCKIIRDPNAISITPYSIHPQTGLVCVPIRRDDIRRFSLKNARYETLQVDNEWWNVPEDADLAISNFLKQMVPINFL